MVHNTLPVSSSTISCTQLSDLRDIPKASPCRKSNQKACSTRQTLCQASPSHLRRSALSLYTGTSASSICKSRKGHSLSRQGEAFSQHEDSYTQNRKAKAGHICGSSTANSQGGCTLKSVLRRTGFKGNSKLIGRGEMTWCGAGNGLSIGQCSVRTSTSTILLATALFASVLTLIRHFRNTSQVGQLCAQRINCLYNIFRAQTSKADSVFHRTQETPLQ